MIEITGLRKRYGTREILREVDLRIRPGAISAIAGPNGCGKTTLIKCLLGLAVPDSGEIRVAGKRTGLDFAYRRGIGYMPQYPDFPHNLKVRELLGMLQDLRKELAPEMHALLGHFGLEGSLEQQFGHLSGGTKQKVAAVAAFMFDPPLLILDEPTAGLDPLSTLKFKNLLRDAARKGKTVLMVSHIMTEVEQLASDLVFMMEGKVVFCGAIDELKREEQQDDLERAITSFLQGRR